MTYEIYATTRFLKEFEKLGEDIRERIKEKVKELCEEPEKGVALTAGLKGKYRLRIGDYRVIYEIRHSEKRIYLLAVGHRRIDGKYMHTETEVSEMKELMKELIIHRVRDYDSIISALKIQDNLRRKIRGEESTEIIRRWRDAR